MNTSLYFGDLNKCHNLNTLCFIVLVPMHLVVRYLTLSYKILQLASALDINNTTTKGRKQ